MPKKSLIYGAIGFLLGGPPGAAIGAAIGYRNDVHGSMLEHIGAIRKNIGTILNDPDKTSRSKKMIREWIQSKGGSDATISDQLVDQIFLFASAYVLRTSDLMESLFNAAKWSNLEGEIISIFQQSLSYFDPESVIFLNRITPRPAIANGNDILSGMEPGI